MAFEINYYVKNKRKNWFAERYNLKFELNYPNSHTFSTPFNIDSDDDGVIATAWGLFSDGSLSSVVTSTYGSAFGDNLMKISSSGKLGLPADRWVKYSPEGIDKPE